MPSNYAAFDVNIDNNDGTLSPVPNQTVDIFNASSGASLGSVNTDANGHVASGSVNVNPGTSVRFRVSQTNGRAGYAEQVTT